MASAFYPILFDFYKPGYVSCWITQDKILLDSLVVGLNYLIPLLLVFVANIIYYIKTRNFLREIFDDVIETYKKKFFIILKKKDYYIL